MKLVIAAMLVASPVLAQQTPPPSGIGRRANYDNAGAIRLVATVGGASVGILAGGFLGYHLLPHCTGCEDPGLDAIVYGSFIGSAIGAAFGAAEPRFRSTCNYKTRFTRTLIGASAGAASMFVLGGGIRKGETALFLVPAGSIGGALIGLGRCWKTIDFPA